MDARSHSQMNDPQYQCEVIIHRIRFPSSPVRIAGIRADSP
jgi:hypothetical protein